MLRHGYELGMGLGQNGDGMASLVRFVENRGRFGLGYEPTHADKKPGPFTRAGTINGEGPYLPH